MTSPYLEKQISLFKILAELKNKSQKTFNLDIQLRTGETINLF